MEVTSDTWFLLCVVLSCIAPVEAFRICLVNTFVCFVFFIMQIFSIIISRWYCSVGGVVMGICIILPC
jgi:hypothetical protein